jgi:hypothetical protein
LIALCSLTLNAAGAADLNDIVVIPTAGQSGDQLRRDRYECHNWVIAQNVTLPAGDSHAEESKRERRASRIGKVLTGAAIGATAGGIIRGARDYRETSDGALAGGVLGAIAGAVAGGVEEREVDDETFDQYFRALDACMSGRGYALSVAGR